MQERYSGAVIVKREMERRNSGQPEPFLQTVLHPGAREPTHSDKESVIWRSGFISYIHQVRVLYLRIKTNSATLLGKARAILKPVSKISFRLL